MTSCLSLIWRLCQVRLPYHFLPLSLSFLSCGCSHTGPLELTCFILCSNQHISKLFHKNYKSYIVLSCDSCDLRMCLSTKKVVCNVCFRNFNTTPKGSLSLVLYRVLIRGVWIIHRLPCGWSRSQALHPVGKNDLRTAFPVLHFIVATETKLPNAFYVSV